MNSKIAFDQFNYYLIQIDIFEDDLDLLYYSDNRIDSSKDLLIESKNLGLAWRGSSSLALIKNRNSSEIKELLVLAPDFFDRKVAMTFAEVGHELIGKMFRKNRLDIHLFNQIKKQMLCDYHHRGFFGAGKISIFNNDYNIIPDMPKNPFFIYMIPKKDSFLDKIGQKLNDDIVENVVKFVECNLWAVVGDCIYTKLVAKGLWDGLLFISLRSHNKNSNRIYLPTHVYLTLRHFALYHYLSKIHSQISNSDLNKFDIKQVKTDLDARTASNFQQDLLRYNQEIISIEISLSTLLPHIKTSLENYTEIIRTITIMNPKIIELPYYYLTTRLVDGTTNLISNIEFSFDSLEKKSNKLINQLRDILNLKYSEINQKLSNSNLSLQKVMIFLTVVITILTIVLVYDSIQF